ncbi:MULTISPECIES: AAA family ATPase [Exiguobacterium]|uniref:AAA family ATPase n=1 Tax=Exiguobacterium TaxID=33986 RepID=UPI000494C4E3|nr:MULTISPECIES: AAA family ATPase [Exiguobacterium]
MLVYYYFDGFRNFKNCDLNFSNELIVNYNKKNKSLSFMQNKNFLDNYWGRNINSITTIAGNNGVGKSTILDSIKGRFFYGFNFLPLETVLVEKKDKCYCIYYSEKLLEENSAIVINDNKYVLSDFQINPKIKSIILDINIGNENIEFQFKKVTIEDIKRNSAEVQNQTRIGNERSLVFYTNQWNYETYNRSYKSNKNREFDYTDLSIGNKIDSLINKLGDYEELFSEDMRIINGVSSENRFNTDYLYELKSEEIKNALRYLNESSLNNKVNDHLIIPEEIVIKYDFMSLRERNDLLLLNDELNIYLRFEKKVNNFFGEQIFYNYILNSKKDIGSKEMMLLIIVENLFSNLDYILFEKIKGIIKEKEKIKEYNLTRIEDIIPLIESFSAIVLEEIANLNYTERFKIERRKKLKQRVEKLFSDYTNFIRYLLTDFLVNLEHMILDTHRIKMFEVDKNSVGIDKIINIKVPRIKITKSNNKNIYNFVNKYNDLSGKNKSLHFSWRNLSSGEIQLLNLCTSLYLAIKDSKHRDVLILLDEAEISLHPMLQKKIISVLSGMLDSSELQEKNIQVVLSTHSPFILSELPFNCLILLKKDDLGNVVVQNELENIPATLGANIHDLFSHSFFLSDGLIGEYAKEKINEVANNLLKNNVNESLDRNYIEKFINQIGEPIIKAKLIELYDQRNILNKSKEMDGIIQDIESLRIQLKKLEERSE